jgi:hypothetical protein
MLLAIKQIYYRLFRNPNNNKKLSRVTITGTLNEHRGISLIINPSRDWPEDFFKKLLTSKKWQIQEQYEAIRDISASPIYVCKTIQPILRL